MTRLYRNPPVYNQDGTITFPLNKGYFTTIDLCDEDLADMRWYALVTKNGHVYAYGGSGKKLLHREIIERQQSRTLTRQDYVDHLNNDGLDNRRSNLRLCSQSQNLANSIPRHNLSGLKGTSLVRYKTQIKWKGKIKHQGTEYYLGVFDTPEEAHEAYKKKAIELFGEFARWE